MTHKGYVDPEYHCIVIDVDNVVVSTMFVLICIFHLKYKFTYKLNICIIECLSTTS